MKRVLMIGLVVLITCLVAEMTVRVYFASVVGPSVLLYGTGKTRHEVALPKQTDEATAPRTEVKDYLANVQPGEWSDLQSLTAHENVLAGYSKYFPRQSRYDFAIETGDRFDVTINNLGFRGRDVVIERAPGTVRVVTLGASSTLGYFSRDDETYPVYLEAILSERLPGTRIEVINLGIPHLKAANIHALFLNEALPLDPDIVTFYEGNNDAMDVAEGLQQQAAHRVVLGALGARLLLVALINSFLGDPFARPQSEAVVLAHADSIATAFVSTVARINAECRKRGIVFIAVSQLRNSQSFDRERLKGMTYEQELAVIVDRLRTGENMTGQEVTFVAHNRIMQRLQSWAVENRVPFADVVHQLDQDRDVLVSWVHLSPRGNRMVAEALADEILRNWPRSGDPR